MNLLDKDNNVLTKIIYKANEHDVISVNEEQGEIFVKIMGYKGIQTVPLNIIQTYATEVKSIG